MYFLNNYLLIPIFFLSLGLDILLTIVNAKDTLLLVHFLPEGEHFNEEKIEMKEYYESELEHSGPAIHSFTFVTRAGEVPLTHAISSYVNEANPHVFAIAPRYFFFTSLYSSLSLSTFSYTTPPY
jgi:hypothetical protein